MLHFNLNPDLTLMILHNNLTALELFVIILNGSQNAHDVKAVLFNMKLITFTPAVNIHIYI